MSFFSSAEQNRTNDHLRLWMETKYMLQNMDDIAIASCSHNVLKLIGSNTDLLTFIISHSNKGQLTKIYNMFKTETTKYNNDKIIYPLCTSLLSSSKAAISHICSFLTRDEIINFKLTSCRISIICLETMQKISIGVCNTNKLINISHNKLPLNWNKLMTFTRYNHTQKYNIIFAQYHKLYNIPKQYQIKLPIHLQHKRKCKNKDIIINKKIINY
eukprot:412633_1